MMKGLWFETEADDFFQYKCSSWKFGLKCRYSDASVKEDSISSTIDIVADVKSERV